MKLVVIQKNTNNTNYLEYLDNVSDRNPDIVCLGELATSGCLYNGGEVIPFDDILDSLKKFNFDICLGVPRKIESNVLKNSYIYYSKGKYQVYDKINLFEPMNETTVYQPGKEIGVFETTFGRIGVAICYDIRFPELFEKLKHESVKMTLIPAAFPRIRIRIWRQLLIERAKKTGSTVIGINAVGDDGSYEFGGSSMVVSAQGEIIAQADEINESIIEVEL